MKSPTKINIDALNEPGTILIDDWDVRQRTGRTVILADPVDVVTAASVDEVDAALAAVDSWQEQGKCLAGYMAYDAGLTLDKPLESRHAPNVPLLWLGVYEDAVELDYDDVYLGDGDSASLVSDIRLNISDEEYLGCVERIKEYICAGDVYQVNYTCKILFENVGTASGLFGRLRTAHPVCHSAFINAGDFQVVSLSPELFLRKTGRKMLTRPMKGTTHRGNSVEEDLCLAEALRLDEKNRAENLMIVDLMRNDIGRISRFGGVSVPRLFSIEPYRSVFQMTSDVEGLLRDDVSTSDIIRGTFPPGSVTGAPKIRAMEIIDELEHESRGVYCGCIGMFKPNGDCLLNVAIRSIVQRGCSCELGVGSGIVADSDPAMELKETLLKGSFVVSEPADFQLLETLLYRTGEGYAFENDHLARMSRSAEFFGWAFDEKVAGDALASTSTEIDGSSGGKQARVRLLASRSKSVEVQWAFLEQPANVRPVLLLASRRIDPDDVFLYHKTTHRQAYDGDFKAARDAGYFDVLYLNDRGELTECATTNLMMRIDGQWFTPKLDCGLLPGIWRARVLAEGKASERILRLDDLKSAGRLVVFNSVRGEIEMNCVESEQGRVWKTPLVGPDLQSGPSLGMDK